VSSLEMSGSIYPTAQSHIREELILHPQ